jgi:hypothetical protein
MPACATAHGTGDAQGANCRNHSQIVDYSLSRHKPEFAMIRRSYLAVTVSLFFMLASSAMAEITFAGGDGKTTETAIIILGATGEQDGVASEYEWLARNRPDAKMKSQALINDAGRVYDLLVVTTGGKDEEIYFDITAFFGKF